VTVPTIRPDLNGPLTQCAVQHDAGPDRKRRQRADSHHQQLAVYRHRRSVDHAKNSAVEGEHEKRDHEADAGQCNCDLNHPESIDYNFLMPGELL
jgi:hypothetical protein